MAIISFEHNFIFIKTTKTASTSIEVDLSQRVGRDAIVTPILPVSPRHVPRNYQTARGNFYNHMSVREIQELLGRERSSSMIKFCVERDPISKCISHFHMLRNSPLHQGPETSNLTWDAYCKRGFFPVDLEKYTDIIDGKRRISVDHVLNFDRLQEDLPKLLASLGIADFNLNSREKSDYSNPRRVNPEQVTQSQRQAIYAAFAETLQLIGPKLTAKYPGV